jgi:F-type H+-transporting ATPase subunit alpha
MNNINQITKDIIADINKTQISNRSQQSGAIIQIYDGIVVIEGLENARYGEVVELGLGQKGMVTDLEESQISALVCGEYQNLKVGDRAVLSGKILDIPVSEKLLGRVVNPLGEPIDGLGVIVPEKYEEVEKIAPGIIYRKSVNEPLQTGIKAIDSLIPIGRGQRELIIGDRSTGKSTLALDTIINQVGQDVICVYVAIGQKEAKVAQVLNLLTEKGAMEYTVLVSASANSPSSMQYIAPYSGTSIAEYFMDMGKDVLIVYDDLSKHAWAYRQISLILKRPAGREAYPGDVFYLHSRLLERAAKLDKKYGGGSITALPIIETQEGDISAYIPTNVISITDGQIYLEKELFNAGMRPAINVGASVSRVGSSAQIKAMKQVAGALKLELAQYRELAAFSQFASELDAETKKTLNRGARMYELLKQNKHEPMKVEREVVAIWLGVNGYTETVPVSEIKRFEEEFLILLEAQKQGLLKAIKTEKQISKEVEKELQIFAQSFLTIFSKETNESETIEK